METIFSKGSTGRNYVAFFDLDRTITGAISGNELVKRALKKDLMSYSDFFHAIYLSVLYKLNLRDPQIIINEMVKWTKGISEQSFKDLCHEVVVTMLIPSIYKEVWSEIKNHKDKNAIIVILSSSLTPVCREMAELLEIDEILCSDLEIIDGYLTGRPIGNLCFDGEKKVRLTDYCKKNNFETASAWYYGDSISDLTALASVGNPVCINPDRTLKKEARKRGWQINQWGE